MEFNPDGNPYNSGLIIDDQGEIKLYYRKFPPWIPVEPWEPGDVGIPVIEGPKGAKIALIICHDGMFPEMARECAYKGAEIMIRTAGYTAPIRESWRFTNQANAFQNLMVTPNVCMCGSVSVRFDRRRHDHELQRLFLAPARPAASTNHHRRIRPDWCAKPGSTRASKTTSMLWHRGSVAVKGGAINCPYAFMQDIVAGTYRLP